MDYSYSTTFKLTDKLKLIIYDWQTKVTLVFENKSVNQFIHLDVDGWTEFKKSLDDIDQEFKRRFNSQYTNV